MLDPDVVVRADGGATSPGRLTRGAAAVASGAIVGARLAGSGHPALINGAPGLVGVVDGRPVSVLAFTVKRGRIAAIDILTDPDRLRRLDLTFLTP